MFVASMAGDRTVQAFENPSVTRYFLRDLSGNSPFAGRFAQKPKISGLLQIAQNTREIDSCASFLH